tara:strand:+ start:13431 stop:14627 length:1197 start_codon:yes stop_codon:yes gene_type:complete
LVNIIYKGLKNKTYLVQFSNRLGFGFNLSKKSNNVIVIHAVSLGEVIGISNLVSKIDSSYEVMITVNTATGFEKANELFGSNHNVMYAPWDFFLFIKKFLKDVRPVCILLFETEIWPYLIHESRVFGVEVFLLNGRLSVKSKKNYEKVKPLITNALNNFSKVFVQSSVHAERFRDLGILKDKIMVVGSMKYDIESNKIQNLGNTLPDEVILAASTHQEEDEIVIEAFKDLKQEKLFQGHFVLAPRHPERAKDLQNICSRFGLNSRLYTDKQSFDDVDITIINVIGIMDDLFQRSRVTFMGGSLVKRGGHNLIEPAYFGSPILIGPHTFNFEDIVDEFISSDAALLVRSKVELVNAYRDVIQDENLATSLSSNAKNIIKKRRGSTVIQLSYIMDIIRNK